MGGLSLERIGPGGGVCAALCPARRWPNHRANRGEVAGLNRGRRVSPMEARRERVVLPQPGRRHDGGADRRYRIDARAGLTCEALFHAHHGWRPGRATASPIRCRAGRTISHQHRAAGPSGPDHPLAELVTTREVTLSVEEIAIVWSFTLLTHVRGFSWGVIRLS